MDAPQTTARYVGTSSDDEELFWPFGSLLRLQLIYEQFVSHPEMNRVTEELLVRFCGLLDFVRTFTYWQQNSRVQKYLREPPRSWKHFLETNLRVNEIDLSRLVRLFVREHVNEELHEDLRYLEQAFERGRGVGYLVKADHDTGQRHVKCAVAAAWFHGECRGDGLARHLLPRFYLLQALCDKLPILTSTYQTSEQYRMSREISGFFALILDAASAENEMYVSEVVDRFLVPHLKSQSELAKSLRDYLPKRYQSWKDFLDRMEFNDEEKVFFALNCDPSREDSLQLLKACESLIKDFNSKYLAEVVRRIRLFDPVAVFRAPEGHTEVEVFYATDRHVTVDGEYIGRHSATSAGREGKELHYGITTVGIPDTEAPIRTLKHVEILSIDTTLQHETQGFVKKINHELLAQEASAREVLLYIHGYNVNHKDAIKQAAQLKHSLKFKGLVIVYSWPSNGTLWGYKHDEKLIEKSAPWLHQFITTLLTEVEEVKKVHILAHNMGNRALIEALQNFQIPDRWSFVQGSTSQSSNRQNIVQVDVKGVLENVIFLAPNAMRARFEDMDFDSICRWRWEQQRHLYFTIYSSAADQKLFLPKRLHEQNQLVDTQSLVHMEKRGKFYSFTRPIEVIDTSGVDINMSPQHSYKYLDCKFLHDDIAKDIQNLLSSHKPAAERHKNILKSRGRSLFLVKHENSPIFYAFNPSRSEKDGNWTLKAESIEQEEIQATAKHSSYQTE